MRLTLLLFTLLQFSAFSQACVPQGNETSYGSNNVWIGYVYDNMNFTSYRGYVNQGNALSPNFDQSFGGNDVNYPTNGCSIATSTFSVRYKLNKYFTSGSYTITVGGDDGYRFSLDGGSTWIIDQWTDHSYQTTTQTFHLSGTYNLVLEYYENGGANRVSFSLTQICNPTENTNVYGTGNVWNGYVYDGINFDTYQGMTNIGTALSPNFDLNFGGDNVMFHTSACDVQTETFSVRFRLRKNFVAGSYQFTIGGDDGYRLSVDGGNTWIIDAWVLQTYAIRSQTVSLSGDHDLVLEYYENTGSNRISFNAILLTLLPVSIESFNIEADETRNVISWSVSSSSNPELFQVEKSTNGRDFRIIGTVHPGNMTNYSYVDKQVSTDMPHYYRIRITDITGVISFSDIQRISTSKTGGAIRIYPTLIQGNSFNLRPSISLKNIWISVHNLSGRQVYTQFLGSLNTHQDVSITAPQMSMENGMLIVTIRSAGELIHTQKILVQ